MAHKPKIALYWCASCGGCEETVLDLDAALLDVAAAVELTLWPVALDFKYADLEALPDGALAVSLINGAVRTGEQQRIAEALRRKSALVIAFGACACWGGIPALANLTSRREILRRAYLASPTVVNPRQTLPSERVAVDGHDVELPPFFETVHALDAVIDVDYYLPGCPPTARTVQTALQAVLEGTLPAKGAVLGASKSLCASCDRNATKPDELRIERVRRVVDTIVDPGTCFLAQGLVCMGPATRGGCEQPCITGNMPCSGCYGPSDPALDQGAKMLGTLGGILAADDAQALDRALEGLPDPAGTFYRYGAAASLLGKQRAEDE